MTAPVKLVSPPDFRTLFESLPGLYLVLACDFTVLAASDAYLEATDVRREHIVGRGFLEILNSKPGDSRGADYANHLRTSVERVVHTRAMDRMPLQKYEIHRSEGVEERCWNPINTPVLNPNGEILCIIHRLEDVTEFVHLVSTVGHDLNNLFGVMQGCEQLLEEQPSNPELMHRLLNQLKQAIEKANALTKRLLAYSSERHS